MSHWELNFDMHANWKSFVGRASNKRNNRLLFAVNIVNFFAKYDTKLYKNEIKMIFISDNWAYYFLLFECHQSEIELFVWMQIVQTHPSLELKLTFRENHSVTLASKTTSCIKLRSPKNDWILNYWFFQQSMKSF